MNKSINLGSSITPMAWSSNNFHYYEDLFWTRSKCLKKNKTTNVFRNDSNLLCKTQNRLEMFEQAFEEEFIILLINSSYHFFWFFFCLFWWNCINVNNIMFTNIILMLCLILRRFLFWTHLRDRLQVSLLILSEFKQINLIN